jgi:glycosyltransferase involved in cell wall biosynthesis
MTKEITILIPVFNDWEACNLLIKKIEPELDTIAETIHIVLVNDGSTDPCILDYSDKIYIRIIHLMRNVGHQKAIAIGLSFLAEENINSSVIVMDCDGEDNPKDIQLLMRASTSDRIIFARRMKRSEGILFRLFYFIYKTIFKLLTGTIISFGNFSLIPPSQLRRLTFTSEIWNNYPGGIIRSRIPYDVVSTQRGRRLAGHSKMNFVNLVTHGMSAIAVFIDTTAVRIMLFSFAMIIICLIGIVAVFSLKFIFQMATPGWASNLISAFFIIVLQAFFISLFMVFTVLSYRTNKHFIPALDFKPFIEKITS